MKDILPYLTILAIASAMHTQNAPSWLGKMASAWLPGQASESQGTYMASAMGGTANPQEESASRMHRE